MVICVPYGIGDEGNEKANDDDRRRAAEVEMQERTGQLLIRLHVE